jgi:hypothetical protein
LDGHDFLNITLKIPFLTFAISGEVREIAEKAVGFSCFYSRTLVNGVHALTTMTTSRTAAAKFGFVSKSKAIVTLERRACTWRNNKKDIKY